MFFLGCNNKSKIDMKPPMEKHSYVFPITDRKTVQLYAQNSSCIEKIMIDVRFNNGTKITINQGVREKSGLWNYLIKVQDKDKTFSTQHRIDLPIKSIWLSDLDKDNNFEILIFHTAGSGDYGHLDFYEFNQTKLVEYELPTEDNGESSFYVRDKYIYQLFPKFGEDVYCLHTDVSKSKWITEKYQFKNNKIIKVSTKEEETPSILNR